MCKMPYTANKYKNEWFLQFCKFYFYIYIYICYILKKEDWSYYLRRSSLYMRNILSLYSPFFFMDGKTQITFINSILKEVKIPLFIRKSDPDPQHLTLPPCCHTTFWFGNHQPAATTPERPILEKVFLDEFKQFIVLHL